MIWYMMNPDEEVASFDTKTSAINCIAEKHGQQPKARKLRDGYYEYSLPDGTKYRVANEVEGRREGFLNAVSA